MPVVTEMLKLPESARVDYTGVADGYRGRIRLPHDARVIPRYRTLCVQTHPFEMRESTTNRRWTGTTFLTVEATPRETIAGEPTVVVAFTATGMTTAPPGRGGDDPRPGSEQRTRPSAPVPHGTEGGDE